MSWDAGPRERWEWCPVLPTPQIKSPSTVICGIRPHRVTSTEFWTRRWGCRSRFASDLADRWAVLRVRGMGCRAPRALGMVPSPAHTPNHVPKHSHMRYKAPPCHQHCVLDSEMELPMQICLRFGRLPSGLEGAWHGMPEPESAGNGAQSCPHPKSSLQAQSSAG